MVGADIRRGKIFSQAMSVEAALVLNPYSSPYRPLQRNPILTIEAPILAVTTTSGTNDQPGDTKSANQLGYKYYGGLDNLNRILGCIIL